MVIPGHGSKEGRYVKMRVEIDLTKSMIRGTKLNFEGQKRWVGFNYEQLPLFCFYCGKIVPKYLSH